MARTSYFSLASFLAVSIAGAVHLSQLIERAFERTHRAIDSARLSIVSLLTYAVTVMAPREGVPRLDLSTETLRQTTARSQVRNFADHRRPRFDRQHVDQGWLAAA